MKLTDIFNINDWLDEDKLGDAIGLMYPDEVFVRNKAVPKSGILKRPDYRCDNLMLIVEFDGYQHYTDVDEYYNDILKDDTYINMGYKIVRIPYFVQLTTEVISHLFGITMEYKQIFPHGFIVDEGEVLPADFCSLGYERFLSDLKSFLYIKNDIFASLHRKFEKYSGDWNRILPTYATNELKAEILNAEI